MDTNAVSSLIGLVIAVVVAVWIYRDAQARGANAPVWAIFGFLFSLITLIVWLIVRPKDARI